MKRWTYAGLWLAVLFALPATAAAVTAKYDRSRGLTIAAAAGERNRIEAGFFGTPPDGFLPFEYVVRDSGVPVVASSGCAPDGAAAKCRITGIRELTVDLGDGADNSFVFFGDADVELVAGGGVDDLTTNAGFDLLDGGAGNDRLRTRDGNDVLRGADGNDELLAETGDDLLDGGLGSDQFAAGPGDDELLAREGVRDTIDCGTGTDTLQMDLKDGAPPASCEKIDKSDRREAPNVRVLRARVSAGEDGAVGVPLACPRAARRGCAGTLSLAIRKAGTARVRYEIEGAHRSRIELRLGAAARRALARSGHLQARLVSLEVGLHGPKTTIRPLVVTRRGAPRPRPRAQSAQAATSSTVSFALGQGLAIKGAAGVANDVRITFLSAPARFSVRDDAGPVAAGPGCAIVTVNTVSCRLRGPRTIRAALGDRDDKLEFALDASGGADAILDGGASFDRLQGAEGYDVLSGGATDEGTDDLDGNAGNDALFGGPGGDTLTGGLGNDFVTGDDGDDRLRLQDGLVDRWCDTTTVILELDPGDLQTCPADGP